VRRRVVFLALLTGIITLPAFAQLSASLDPNGNMINYTAGGGRTTDPSMCVTYVLLDGQNFGGSGNAYPCSTYPYSLGSFYCNTAGVHVVSAYAQNTQGTRVSLGPDVTITVTAPPPDTCTNNKDGLIEFSITDSTPEDDRRVLQSNLHPGYPYPHYQALLAQDAVIPMSLRTVLDGVQTSGATVTLSFIDPPDRSPYMAGPSGTPPPTPPQPVPGPRANDNAGPLPTLTGNGITDNGNHTYSAVSGQNGFVGWNLVLDPAARAGDNYQILAQATFPDSRIAGGLSGAVTVWKRLFVEKQQMFRRGAALATDAPIGLNSIVIPDGKIASTGITAFARNDYVMLLHAPSWGTTKGSSYRGVYQIAVNPARFRATAQTNGTGTVTTSGSAAIVGTGTRFTQLAVGNVITVGTNVRFITAITDNTHLTVDTPIPSASNQPYKIGDANLIPGTYYVRLTLNRALTERYGIEPLATPGVLTLNDAVVRLSAASITAADYYDADHTALTMPPAASQFANPFSGAYTEYVVLPPQPTPTPVPRMVLTSDALAQQFVDKWFALPTPRPVPSTSSNRLDWYRYDTAPNHQLLLVGDADSVDVTQSHSNGFLSRAIAGEKASILNRGTVEWGVTSTTTPMYQGNADTILRRTLVHEITHQWWVNDAVFGSTLLDHCHPEVAYNSTSSYPSAGTPPTGLRFCLMSSADQSPLMPPPWNPSGSPINMVQYKYRDGFTSYHITQLPSGWNSEYLGIRRTLDPWRP